MLVRQVIYGKVKVYTATKLLRYAEVQHVQPRRANASVFSVQPVVADMAIQKRGREAVKVCQYQPGVSYCVRRAINIDSGPCAAKVRIHHLSQSRVE